MSKTMPIVVEKTNQGERSYDLASRLMQDRIITIDSDVTENLAHIVGQQLVYLDSLNSEDITLYLNSPGGSCHDGMKIQDMMDLCRSDIVIIGTGQLCSMGCYLLSKGTPGKRFLTKRAQVMAHQASSGTQGHVADQIASLEHTKYLNELLCNEIADAVGKPIAGYMKDVVRDFWMNAEEAVMYGKKGFADGIYDGKRDSNGDLVVITRADLKKKNAASTKAKNAETVEE